MQASAQPRVKICCIGSLDEAWLAIRHGAAALGLVSAMPSGPGPIEDALIAAIAARVPPPVSTFLLTCEQDADAVIARQRAAGTSAVQLVDALPAGSHARLRAALPGVRLVQVVHVTGPASIDEALAIAPEVDALLLDSGDPSLPVKELGGTGRVHDWSLSRAIREGVDVPVFLAGGLRPENARAAVETVGPFALDVCSGVRREGRLHEPTLAAFFEALG